MDSADWKLLVSGAPVGIRVDTDESMHLVEIADGVIQNSVGTGQVETLSGSRIGVVFWFAVTGADCALNRTATLNLFATAGLPASTLPLLRGTVLITGRDSRGHPDGLTPEQIAALGAHVGRRAVWTLQWREWRSRRERRERC